MKICSHHLCHERIWFRQFTLRWKQKAETLAAEHLGDAYFVWSWQTRSRTWPVSFHRTRLEQKAWRDLFPAKLYDALELLWFQVLVIDFLVVELLVPDPKLLQEAKAKGYPEIETGMRGTAVLRCWGKRLKAFEECKKAELLAQKVMIFKSYCKVVMPINFGETLRPSARDKTSKSRKFQPWHGGKMWNTTFVFEAESTRL